MSTNESERDDASNEPAATEPEETANTESPAPTASGDEGSTDEPSTPAQAEEPAAPAATQAEPSAPSAKAESTSSSSSSKASAAQVTPGQRIAAQKAAKAAQKAAEKARRAEEAAAASESADAIPDAAVPSVPDELELRAAEVRGAFEKNTGTLMKVGVAVLAGVVLFAGVSAFMQHRARASGELLLRAVEASRASIGSAEGQSDGRLRFESEAARDRETATRFRKVISEHAGSDAARYAHLGLARLLMGEGKYAEAQAEVRAASERVTDDPGLEALTLEASALAYTGEQKYAEAQRAIDRLAQIDRRRYRDVADYLAARVLFDRGDRNGAKEKLRGLLDRLDDEGATPLDHVEDQARNLMRQIDPSAVPANAPMQLSPEMLQMLLQQQGLGGAGQ